VVQRRTVFLLRKAREREHILEGYKIALDNLDTVIRIIRASGSRAEARENLYAWGKGTEIVVTLDRERLPHEERGLTLGRSTPFSNCNSTGSPSFPSTNC
jgi:DNA gyrase subunit A